MRGIRLIEQNRALDPTPRCSSVRSVVEELTPPARGHGSAPRAPHLLSTGYAVTMVASGNRRLSRTTVTR